MREIYIEIQPDATYAWLFNIEHWGLAACGVDEANALAELEGSAFDAYREFLGRHGEQAAPLESFRIAERLIGDELAFEPDKEPATKDEMSRTLQILSWARQDLLARLLDASEEELDWNDPARSLPPWAWWRTARQMAWHIALTESHYYLGRLGLRPPEPIASVEEPLPAPRSSELLHALEVSAAHVRDELPRLPPMLCREAKGEVWTTTKVLRRLAWHERSENEVVGDLLRRARAFG